MARAKKAGVIGSTSDIPEVTSLDDVGAELPTRSGEFIEVTIRLPIAKPSGFIATETARCLGTTLKVRDERQLNGMRLMHAGFYETDSRLSNGKHVDSLAAAFCKLLELIDEAYTANAEMPDVAAAS